MTAKVPDVLSDVPEALAQIQASSRRAIPVMVVGLVATLLAAGISSYYAFYLGTELKAAQDKLDDTSAELASTRSSIADAVKALGRIRDVHKPDDQQALRKAMSLLGKSEVQIASASNTLGEAASKIPGTAAATDKWFVVVGSYGLSPESLDNARRHLDRLTAVGRCGEIRRTQVSEHYAVVLGTAAGVKAASADANAARDQGIARDAFPQKGNDWTLVTASPSCDAP